ncbi:uncharacterized protein LOC112551322 [Alligator sinensis]|uniref:Uncharacterized protein LOC112551322 n=1 Tax=Alligator sinensis TaxID=38654 RepID=A0A3Q0H5Y0_ALLSI|nr:uncharacterized protein LOC112551322 [Alligator sinensis]
MPGPAPADTQVRGPNWTHAETSNLIAIWGDIEAQQQFAHSTRANAHVFKEMARRMQECGHQRTSQQCRVKAKALRAQYIRFWDNNKQSRATPRTMPFLHELEKILAPTDPGEPHQVFSSCGLEKPMTQEDSLGEGTSGLSHQVPVHSLLSDSPTSSGSPGHHLPWLFWRWPSEDDRGGMSPADASSSSSQEGATTRLAICHASLPWEASAFQTSSLWPGTTSNHGKHLPYPPDPAAGHGGEPPGNHRNGTPKTPEATASAHNMRRLRQCKSQDWTDLLNRLVTVSEEQLEESRTWHRCWLHEFHEMCQAMEQSDCEDREAWRVESEVLHALLQRLVEAQEDQRDVV